MKRYITYIENYKNVKIYQYNDNKKYTATPYIYLSINTDAPRIYSIENEDLESLKVKIDEIINKYIKKYRNLD